MVGSDHDTPSLADILLLSVLRSENDLMKIASAISSWRRATKASTPELCGSGNPEAHDYADLIDRVGR